MLIKTVVLLLLLAFVCSQQKSKITRYWDCCKPSCSWNDKARVSQPVSTCAKDGKTRLTDVNQKSSCDGGEAYACTNQMPWAINSNLSYGFAAVRLPGRKESDWCCSCYLVTFGLDGTGKSMVKGKKMILQATNTGGDLGPTSAWDLQIPGGGVGLFNGCKKQWNAPDNGWGDRYGGVKKRDDCKQLPKELQPGCHWRFDWFGGADNPIVEKHERVPCPKEITDKTGCVRSDEQCLKCCKLD